jgi:hypothetical protein
MRMMLENKIKQSPKETLGARGNTSCASEGRLALVDAQGGSESGFALEGPSPFLSGVDDGVHGLGRKCSAKRREICFSLCDRFSLARVSGNLLWRVDEAKGASFPDRGGGCVREGQEPAGVTGMGLSDSEGAPGIALRLIRQETWEYSVRLGGQSQKESRAASHERRNQHRKHD